MIPIITRRVRNGRRIAVALLALAAGAAVADESAHPSAAATPLRSATPLNPPTPLTPANPLQPVDTAAGYCLPSGDGYLRAHLRGAIDADIDWKNRGTVCEGEARSDPKGVRMSFSRAVGPRAGARGTRNLLFVFGITGVGEGESLSTAGTNLTILVQGTSRIFGTQGDGRCAIERLTQRRFGDAHSYRVEARGYCVQPAHAVRGDGEVLVSRFDLAGRVNYPAADAP
jgi:hypothetical protein